MSSTRVWVVGASGLLGASVVRAARQRGWTVQNSVVPWDRPDDAVAVLVRDAHRFLDTVGMGTWAIAWCAGAGVVGAAQADLARELLVFSRFIDSFGVIVDDRGLATTGAFFFASSAGGVYAGSTGAPFTEATAPAPLAPYGELKLRAEGVVQGLVEQCGLPAVIGRISNLFGPGQDLRKPQGLISQIGRSCLTRQPISLYVSLDTMRDYLFVDDCARRVVQALERAAELPPGPDAAVTKILASGRSTTISGVLGEYRRVFKRPAPITLGTSPSSRFQVRDLRLRSTVWTDLDDGPVTTLGAGIAATVRDVSNRLHS